MVAGQFVQIVDGHLASIFMPGDVTNFCLVKPRMTKLAPWESSHLLRDARQDFLHLLEVGGLDQEVIEPGFLRTLPV